MKSRTVHTLTYTKTGLAKALGYDTPGVIAIIRTAAAVDPAVIEIQYPEVELPEKT